MNRTNFIKVIIILLVIPIIYLIVNFKSYNLINDLPSESTVYKETNICIKAGLMIGTTSDAYLITLDCNELNRKDISELYLGSRNFENFKTYDAIGTRDCQDINLKYKNDIVHIVITTDYTCAWLENAKIFDNSEYKININGSIEII